MAPIASTVALSHVPGVSDSARERELFKYFSHSTSGTPTSILNVTWTDCCLCRYYQPNTPINAETCFPSIADSGNAVLEDDYPDTQADIRSDITSSKISSPDTALTAFCQLVTWRTGAQRAMIRSVVIDFLGEFC